MNIGYNDSMNGIYEWMINLFFKSLGTKYWDYKSHIREE